MKTGRRRTLSARVGLSAIVLFLFSALGLAQAGQLEGTVRDNNGNPQPGVVVEIAGQFLLGRSRTTTTDREGKYTFSQLPTGMFTMAFRSQGFLWLLLTNVSLDNRPTPLDAQLTPGDMSDVVAVKYEGTTLITGKPRQPKPEPFARAREIVQQLGQLPDSLPGRGRSDGKPDPMDVWRSQVYDELRALRDASVPALIRGLSDPDVQVRRNVALFLGATGGGWYDKKPPLDLRPYLTALTAALTDADSRVRGLSAQAVGVIGPDASSAVPALITLLANPDEGSRNSACIGLAGIGPSARAALPALRQALSDPSADVRRFAARAISMIDQQ
jgi:hypothetical protein